MLNKLAGTVLILYIAFIITGCSINNHREKDIENIGISNAIGNSGGNIINEGIITKQGEWLYYINPADNNKIYKTKTDMSGKAKLCNDKSSCLNVIGNWLYYVNWSDRGKIYKVMVDGTNRKKICDMILVELL